MVAGPVCPHCGSEKINCEYVDIGVGLQQVTPFECQDCGARQFYSLDDRSFALADEIAVGWFKGL